MSSVSVRSGRTQSNKPNTANRPRAAKIEAGAKIEIEIEGAWWPAVVVGAFAGLTRAQLEAGAPRSGYVVMPTAAEGKVWRRTTLAVHHVPLTSQGVRNLNMAAPPKHRNGRHFRKPKNWIVLCPHDVEERTGEVVEEERVVTDELGHERRFTLRFEVCGGCGAEVG